MHTPAAVPHLILCLRALGVSEYIHVRAWMRQERTTDDSGDTHDDLHTEDHQTVSILDLHCDPPWIAHLQHSVESEWISVHEGAARALEYFTQSTSAPVSKCHAYSVRLQYTTTSPVYLM